MNRGQSNIILFPVFMLLLLGAWAFTMNSILTTSTEMHAASLALAERQKKAGDAGLGLTDLPSPIDENSTIVNTGASELSNLKVYLISGNVTEYSVSDRLYVLQEEPVAVAGASSGDHLLVFSDEDAWHTAILPQEQRADAGWDRLAGSVSLLIDTMTQPPTSTYHALGSENEGLFNATQQRLDGDEYEVGKNGQCEFVWNLTEPCYNIGSQIQIYGNNTGAQSVVLEILPYDGQNYAWAYDCTFANGYSSCVTPNLSGKLAPDDDGLFRVRMTPTVNSFYFDYMLIDLRCVV